VARYGIDIWMTTTAITRTSRSASQPRCQDPRRQDRSITWANVPPVLYVLFTLMERFEGY